MDGGYVIAGTSDSAGGSIRLMKTDSLGRILPAGLAGHSFNVQRSSITVTPNPCRSSATISCSSSFLSPRSSLSLYDAAGLRVRSSFGLRTSPFRLDLRSMPAGVYLLRLESAGGTATRKLVVE
jgi:hypothetical protein